jgi:hypothetical protein
VKAVLVELFGGACVRCGYDEHDAALQFHHRDSSEKEFGISTGLTIGLDRLKEEARKCDMICANCHAIEHSAG